MQPSLKIAPSTCRFIRPTQIIGVIESTLQAAVVFVAKTAGGLRPRSGEPFRINPFVLSSVASLPLAAWHVWHDDCLLRDDPNRSPRRVRTLKVSPDLHEPAFSLSYITPQPIPKLLPSHLLTPASGSFFAPVHPPILIEKVRRPKHIELPPENSRYNYITDVTTTPTDTRANR